MENTPQEEENGPPEDPSTRGGQSNGAGPGASNSKLKIFLRAPLEGEVTSPLQLHPIPLGQEGMGEPGRPIPRWWSSLAGKDASLPRSLTFRWHCAMHCPTSVRYDLSVRAEDGSGETFLRDGLRDETAEVENLRIGTNYSWWVRGWIGHRQVAVSPMGTFRTHAAPPRWIHAEGVTNVRDLGGWPLPGGHRLRQGMIFRGSELNSHCALTSAGAEVLERLLNIRTDLDLRGPGEERMAVLDGGKVRYVNIPLASYDMIASPQYTRLYRELFQLLAQPATYPVYMHCWGGADRTGTAAFLLGALLGMTDDDLFTDYELTSLSVWGERRATEEAFQEMLQILALFAPAGAPIHEQVERYLRVIGVKEEETAAIRALLTE